MELKEIERSIIKKYRKVLWARFIDAVKKYNLIEEGDKIAVCISGGKDSFLLAKLMQEILLHGDREFTLKFICMNPGYKEENAELINGNARALNIPVDVFHSDIFKIVTSAGGSPCYLCARMRRGYLYEKAKTLGCNKIALGHHFNDVIETTLLSMIYGGEIRTMLPKLKSTSHEGMQLIRPMYLIREEDIIAWADYCGLKFLNCACRFTENVAENKEDSKRREIKLLIKQLKNTYSEADKNIFSCMQNVNIENVLAYKKRGVTHSFLEEFDDDN